MKHLTAFMVAAYLLSAGCAYFRGDEDLVDTSGFALDQVKQDMKPVQVEGPYHPTPAILEYFDYYNLNPVNAEHYFGSMESEGYTLAAHAFIPPQPKGTLVLIHGYFDHTGTLAKLIHKGLEHGYAIAVWDLPGHGLSTGERTDTDGFDLCARQLVDIISRLSPAAPQPMYLIGHSTGCSIAMEYMAHAENHEIDGYIFLAPLIRHTHWRWAKFGYTLARPFKSSVRRRDKKNSSDEDYLTFVKKDPLHSAQLSFEYLDELYAWEKRMHTYPPWPGEVLIIQGDQDDIVEWEYNLNLLTTRIPNAEVHIIPEARHQLANESPAIRNTVFDLMFDYLDKKSTDED